MDRRQITDCTEYARLSQHPSGWTHHYRTVTSATLHRKPGTPLSNLRFGLPRNAFDRLRGVYIRIDAQALDDLPDAEAIYAIGGVTRDRRVSHLSFHTSRWIPAVEYIRPRRARTLLTTLPGRLWNEGPPLRLALAYQNGTSSHTQKPPAQ